MISVMDYWQSYLTFATLNSKFWYTICYKSRPWTAPL